MALPTDFRKVIVQENAAKKIAENDISKSSEQVSSFNTRKRARSPATVDSCSSTEEDEKEEGHKQDKDLSSGDSLWLYDLTL